MWDGIADNAGMEVRLKECYSWVGSQMFDSERVLVVMLS